MPKRTDIHKILIIGSGPIVIGQACEFDYSGTQACRALKSLGYEIILINSNPATVMTDPEMADRTYLEPLDAKRLEQVIEKERPDALLPNLGGQTGLNLCAELAKNGILEKYGIQVIGADAEAIERGENRIAFKKTMEELGIGMAKSEVAYSVDEALKIADSLGYPVVVRPAYTMGGTGGGLVYNRDELRTVADRGIGASLIHQILVEESVLGWEELELEVLRDSADNMVTACFIENVDPCGIHTGDSFCTAPMLTVPAEVQAELGAEGREPAGHGVLRTKAGDHAGRRVEHHVDSLPVRLALHAGKRHIRLKMAAADVPQLMLQRLLLQGRGEPGVDIDVIAPVIIWQGDPLHLHRQGDQTHIGVSHDCAAPR